MIALKTAAPLEIGSSAVQRIKAEMTKSVV
jgi:hypothetical protein